MLFDKLCMLCERYMKNLIPYVDKARLFQFPGRAHEVLPKEISDENKRFLQDEFFLPFPVVAIEDKASCIVLVDEDKEAIGINSKRYFVECMELNTDINEFREGKEGKMTEDRSHLKGNYVVIMGVIEGVELVNEKEYVASGSVLNVGMGTKENFTVRSHQHFSEEEWQPIMRSGLVNAMTALEEIMYFNTPDRFVLEVASTKMRKNKGKMQRSQDRPIYILLKPKEIRDRMKLPIPDKGKLKQPHERRRHTRFLTSPRFTHKRWTTIVIPATWIGPSENVVNKKRYKVCLNI